MKRWRIGSINVQTGRDALKVIEHLEEASRAGLAICCMQEMRKAGNGCEEIEVTDPRNPDRKVKWRLYWSGHKSRSRDGVAVAIRMGSGLTPGAWQAVSARVIFVDLKIFGLQCRVASVYAPTNEGTPAAKQAFYTDLAKCEVKKGQLIICGDLNASGKFDRRFGMRPENTNVTELLTESDTDNGRLWADFLREKSLDLVNTFHEHKALHRHTWYHANAAIKFSKTIDYIAQSKWIADFCVDVRVKRDFFSSDHRLLIARMATPSSKNDFPKFRRKTKSKKRDLALIRTGIDGSKKVKTDFLNALDNLVSAIEKPGDVVFQDLVDILQKASESIPTVQKTQEQKIWDDKVLIDLKKTRWNLKRDVDVVRWKEVTKAIRKRMDQLRNVNFAREADQLNDLAETRRIEKLYKRMKSCNNVGKKVPDKKPEGLRNYFQVHFNHEGPQEPAPSIADPPDDISKITANYTFDDDELERLRHPPDKQEILKIIDQLKSKKSYTDIAPEILQLAANNARFTDLVVVVLQNVWKNGFLPENWRKTVIHALFKNKGSQMDCKNWRGLAIGSTFLKVCMSIILSRTARWYNATLHPAQAGFRRGYGCSTASYTLHQLHHVYKRAKKPLWGLFLDFKAAYDWLKRQDVFQAIYNRIGDCPELRAHFEIIENLYRDTKSRLSDDPEGEASYFTSTSGLRQGGSESPAAYNLLADALFRDFERECQKEGIGAKIRFKLPTEVANDADCAEEQEFLLCLLGYADDTVIFAESAEELQKAADIMARLLELYGLHLSVEKKSIEFLPVKRKKAKNSTQSRHIFR